MADIVLCGRNDPSPQIVLLAVAEADGAGGVQTAEWMRWHKNPTCGW